MTDHLVVDPEYLDGLVFRLEDATAHIEKLLAALDRSVGTLGGQWTGAASAAYREAHAAWTDDLAAMNATLGRLAKAVKNSNDEDRDTESRNARAWK
jgi:WXG100 family type VII secretion target